MVLIDEACRFLRLWIGIPSADVTSQCIPRPICPPDILSWCARSWTLCQPLTCKTGNWNYEIFDNWAPFYCLRSMAFQDHHVGVSVVDVPISIMWRDKDCGLYQWFPISLISGTSAPAGTSTVIRGTTLLSNNNLMYLESASYLPFRHYALTQPYIHSTEFLWNRRRRNWLCGWSPLLSARDRPATLAERGTLPTRPSKFLHGTMITRLGSRFTASPEASYRGFGWLSLLSWPDWRQCRWTEKLQEFYAWYI